MASTLAVSARVTVKDDQCRFPNDDCRGSGLSNQLDFLRRSLERQCLAVGGSSTEALLETVLRLRYDLSGHDVATGSGRFIMIRTAVDSLRGLSSRETLTTAMKLLTRDFGFSRVMVSTVREYDWLPQHVYGYGLSASNSCCFKGFSVGVPIPLDDSPGEAALICRRRRIFVSRQQGSDQPEYLAAPITVGDRVIGMLHAEFPTIDEIAVADPLDLVETFVECLGAVYERAVLEEKASQQRLEVDRLCTTVDQLLPPLAVGQEPTIQNPGSGSSELTPREREVMSYVATGATNRDIARHLLISEGTVKSHLKRIAVKLNTTNRAAALAMYLSMSSVAGD